MNIINMKDNKFYQYILTLFGLFAIFYYIWFRFLRERLPRDIPFESSLFILLLLGVICGIYLYILLRLCIPKPPNKYIVKLLTIYYELYKPLIETEKKIRSNVFISFIISKLFYLFSIFTDRHVLYYTHTNIAFYILINLFPKAILTLFFVVDIFYFHQLSIFYSFICLGLIPLIFQYLLYIIKEELENKIKYLDDHFCCVYVAEEGKDDDCHPYIMYPSSLETNYEGLINTRYFIDRQSDALTLYCDLYKYDCIETLEAREEYEKKHNLEPILLVFLIPRHDEIACILAKDFDELMPQVINISAYFKECENNKEKINKKSMIIMVIIYLICWIYILIVTFFSIA
jgi:xanthosine utilization system XapX-like protein